MICKLGGKNSFAPCYLVALITEKQLEIYTCYRRLGIRVKIQQRRISLLLSLVGRGRKKLEYLKMLSLFKGQIKALHCSFMSTINMALMGMMNW